MIFKLKLHQHNLSYFISATLLIFLVDLIIVKSELYQEKEQLMTIGIALDFVVAIPLLLYLLVYRRLNKRITSLLPAAFIGGVVLMLLLPDSNHSASGIVKKVLVPLEILFLCYGIYIIYQLIVGIKHRREVDSHPLKALHSSLESKLGKTQITSLLVHELSVIYYAFFCWRKSPYVRSDATSFSYHSNSSWLIIILMLSKVLLIEGACVHILLMHWFPVSAWVLSFGNLYVIMLLIADYRAMCLNPVLVSSQKITLQYGLQIFASIHISNIESVSIIKFEKLTKGNLKTAVTPLVIEPNILIRLKSKITVTRLFGRQQSVDHVYLYLDKPSEFQIECHQLINL